jgi:hypothetical protein
MEPEKSETGTQYEESIQTKRRRSSRLRKLSKFLKPKYSV